MTFTPPPFYCLIRAFMRPDDTDNIEVQRIAEGYMLDVSAKGPINMSGAFIGTAILRLATSAADCVGRPASCENTIYGFRPSTLLTASSTIVGLAATIFMPLIGAMIDFSPYRRQFGLYTGLLLSFFAGISIFLSEKTWFFLLIMEAIAGFLMVVHGVTALAYLPDLSPNDPDKLASYTTKFNVRQFICSAVFVGGMTGISSVLRNPVKTAQVSQAVSSVWSMILVFIAWRYLLPNRLPRRPVPENGNILFAGFQQIFKTSKEIFTRYCGLKWYLISLLWSPDAGAGVFISITVTFMVALLKMNITQVGLANLTMIVFNIPGSWLSRYLCHRMNALRSFQICLIFFAANILGCAATLKGPDQKQYIFIFAATWGIAFGWLYPSQRVLYCIFSPKGQENEMMGVFTFYGQILGWLPPFVFSVLNEQGVSLSWGMASLAFYFLLSLFCTLFIDYEQTIKEVNVTDDCSPDEEVQSNTIIDNLELNTTAS